MLHNSLTKKHPILVIPLFFVIPLENGIQKHPLVILLFFFVILSTSSGQARILFCHSDWLLWLLGMEESLKLSVYLCFLFCNLKHPNLVIPCLTRDPEYQNNVQQNSLPSLLCIHPC